MKGTFLSADFIEDSNGNVKFLELNTDTSADGLIRLYSNPWVNLIELISGSSLTGQEITKFHVIHKPAVHQNVVDNLSQSLAESASHIVSFTEHLEELETIYPINVTDADDTFILRLAYDENAILDSTYCKDGTNSLLLFDENNDLDSAVPYYYSSSTQIVNSLNTTLNPDDYPDFVVKSNATNESVGFYKAGPVLSGSTYVSSSEFTGERISNFTSSFLEGVQNENTIIMNYLYPSETDTDGAVSSIRTYHIVYGNSLDVINLGGGRVYAPFSLPTGSQINWNDSTSSIVQVGKEHYHEFSTSTIKENAFIKPGAFETEKIVSASGETVDVEFIYENYSGSNIELKTIFISGSPDGDAPSDYLAWYHNGNELPSGSYTTSSTVVNVIRSEVEDFSLVGVTISGSSETQYISPISNILVYESSSNETKFLPVKQVFSKSEPGYFAYGTDGTLKKIIDTEYIILKNNTTGSFYSIDVETNDYYFVGDFASVSLGLHNCFVTGTEVLLSNNDVKNIEDLREGDEVLSFDVENNKTAVSIIGSVSSHEVNQVVRLTINNEKVIVCTPEHPFYVVGKGYQKAKDLDFGFDLLDSNGNSQFISTVEILDETHIVYNLHNVEPHKNFFVDYLLVHNKDPFGK